MAITRAQKEATLKQLTEDLKNARGVVFTEYKGLSVKDMDKLRKILRKEKVKYQVVKVTLIKKVLEKLGISSEAFKYSGPVAVAISAEEETTAPRLIKQAMKDFPALIIDGGIFNQALVGSDVIVKLASLPSKQELLAQLVSVIAGPMRGLVTVLSGNTRNLLNVLKAIEKVKS